MAGLGEIVVLAALAVVIMILLGLLRIYVRRQGKDRFSIDVQVGRKFDARDEEQLHR